MKFRNEYAVFGLPTYLTVAIITTSAIFAVFSYSIYNLTERSQTDIVKKQIERIISEAENMFEHANTGSKVTFDIDFPDSMSFLVLSLIHI